ncbi:unnamed protein product [Calypogeia fissa]
MANSISPSLVPSSIPQLSVERTRHCAQGKLCASAYCNLRQRVFVNRIQKGIKQARTYSRELGGYGSHSLHQESMHSARLPPIRAQMVEFKARREVSIPFREGAVPAVEYLNELERVVKVTFPDSARITYMGDSVWRTRLKPITFITLSATPVCDIKVYNENNTLKIYSDQLLLDFSGLPEEYVNQSVRFTLQGQLQVDGRKGSQYKAGREVDFNGVVSLSLRASLPLPFALLPGDVVTTVGDTILDTILGAMESALVRGIIADYHTWCRIKQNMESKRALGVTGSI